uniref:Kinesin motor domain-containing protein n=1 Tax=Oryza meridionalis TaxID=40149 RepID=A0A0E0FDL7_9ORYZ
MVRDLAAVRRTPARASSSSSASEVGNDENAPVDASDAAAAAARPPLLAIQPPQSGLKRKPESPAPTPSKLPFRTPEKAAARSRFGWVPPRGDEQPPPRVGGTPYSAVSTPGRHRGKSSAAAAAASEGGGGSTQSTPTKSVTKPAYSIGMSASRPPMSGGQRGAGLGLGFSMAARGTPMSFAPVTVVNTAEVPHFELREDPSFWMENNVQVVIRVRPLNNTERNLHNYNRCLKQESAQSITWIGQPESRFTFDHVACEAVNQEVLFRVAGLPMVENCMAGYNSCIFAYGQTGSGKTYTMLGEISELEVRPSPDRGMTPRIFEFLFARIRAEEESRRDEKLKYNCKCSFLEIYNEQITDLLDPSSTNLPLREDIRNGVYVENLTELEVGCVSDIIKLLMQGSANRKVAATNMNHESSRSHSVFTCIIESRWEKDSASNLRFARLNLVDLAGSERHPPEHRQRTSGAEGERLKEAANINKSLSTLGLVIMSLVDQAHGKQRHVPYRDSRLTFLLQDSLGGNSKTMIIANVSPSVCSASETLSTLKFAQRARLIQNNAVVNEDASGDVLALQHQIRLLKEELAVLKRQRVPRSLSFTSDIFERSGVDVDDGTESMNMDEENDNDAHDRRSLQDLRISNKQLRLLEETLAGAFRRESVAEATVKQLEAEIEQLNRLVYERENDTRSAKMTLKFREDKIHQMEALVRDKLPAESYLLEENNTLLKEIDLLRAKIDKNPEVTRFALENIRLSNKLKSYNQFCNEGEREHLLNEVSILRNQVLQILERRAEAEQPNNFPANFELKRTSQELETCRGELQACLEANKKLAREIADLQNELSNIHSSNREGHPNVVEKFSSALNQYDSHAPEKKDQCFQEGFMINTDDILNLQLELDIIKTILAEERTTHAEVEKRITCLDDELKAANIHILETCRQSETMQRELSDARSVIEALESQQIMLINELDELKESNQQSLEHLKKRDLEISRLNNELDVHRRQEFLAMEEPKVQLLKCFENDDSPLQTKLKRMQASLEKARKLNTRYQRDQASHSSAQQEMDEVSRQVEVETAEVIMCLQEELISLQHQLDASSKNELLANQRIDEARLEREQLNDRLLEVMKENECFSALIEEKDKKIGMLTNDWDKLASDIGNFLLDGNAALDEASDQVAFISESISQRKWIEDQVQKMCRGISQRDELLKELQSRLKEADDIRCDLDLKLRSLRGAMQAINDTHQQEKNDQENVMSVLRSQVSNERYVNQQQLQELQRIQLLLDESIESFVQKEVIEQSYISLQRAMEEVIHHLESQLDQSKRDLTQLLSETQDKEQAFERLKNEENGVLLTVLSDVLKAKGVVHEFETGFNAIQSSFSVDPEEVVCQNSDLNLEDRVGCDPTGAFEAGEKHNGDVLCKLSKEMECVVYTMQMLQSQMVKLLQEKENAKEYHFQSQRTIKDVSAKVLQLKSEIIDKEKGYEARLKELEIKMQEKEKDTAESFISWNKEREALELEVSEAKSLAIQKSFEASTLISKFEEAQATISDADTTVNALVEANEKAKLQIQNCKENEALFLSEKERLLTEISSLKMLLGVKDQTYENLLLEKLEFVSSDVEWMKSKLQQFAELARTWLEENWLEIIGKDCAVSVLHLCHMGILLERITGLNAENGFLQRGLCESNSLISKLREHNDRAKNELEMCSVLKGKLLLDINHNFSRISKKEQEATELNSRLDAFEKKILHLQAQEEAMLARSNSMYNELSILVEEIDATNKSALATESKEKEELRHQLDEALLCNAMLKDIIQEDMDLPQVNNYMKGCSEFELCNHLADYHNELVTTNIIAKDIESYVLSSELVQHKAQLQKQELMFIDALDGLTTEATLSRVDKDLGSAMMAELVANLDSEKLFVTIQGRLEQVADQVQMYTSDQLNMVTKVSNEIDFIQILLQESASVAKDQADELIQLTEAIESLEQELDSKSNELVDAVSGRQLLEAQILKSNQKVSALEEQLASKINELKEVSVEKDELTSKLNHIEGISYNMEDELADKGKAIERLEEELIELRSLLDARSSFLQNLQNDFSKLLDEKKYCETQVLILNEKLEMAQALAEESEAIATEAKQMAEERKTHAEEKDEEVKLLERSIEELESTVCALENKVDIIKEEAERQRMHREEIELELQKVRQQMLAVPSSGQATSSLEGGMGDFTDSSRHSREIKNELLAAQENIRILQKDVAEKETEIAQCKAHISELNIHAEAAAREYKQKFMELEAMAQQVKSDNTSANACSTRPEKISLKPRGSGSPFKCIGLGFVQQMNSEKDEELSAAKQRIMELEGIAASRQREIFMLNARLATTESMTHDVIRDMLGVKMNMATWAALVDNQQQMDTQESAVTQAHESKEQSDELMKLRSQLDELIEERQSWLDEINQRQSELGAARITIEKLRQKEHFMVAEIELLKAENVNGKAIIFNLEDEVKKLTRQQNLQLRINHHEENNLLKKQNEELSAKLQKLGDVVARTKEELARYRVSDGKDPYEQMEEEELLRNRLEESEQDRSKLAENLSSLCATVLKIAGVRNHESDASLLKALEALNQIQLRIASMEAGVEDLKLKLRSLQITECVQITKHLVIPMTQLTQIEAKQDELADKCKAIKKLEDELIEFRNLLDVRSSFLQNVQNDFSKLLDEKKYCGCETHSLNTMVEERKLHTEKKDEEVKLMESEHHYGRTRARMKREELELEFAKSREQMLTVPSSAMSSLESGIDLTDSSSHPGIVVAPLMGLLQQQLNIKFQ